MSKMPLLEALVSLKSNVDLEVFAVPASTPQNSEYASLIKRLNESGSFTGKAGSHELVKFAGKNKADSVLFVGIGKSEEFTEEKARQAGSSLWGDLCRNKIETVSVNVGSFDALKETKVLRAFTEGLLLAAYTFEKHKTKQDETRRTPTRITFVAGNETLAGQLREDFAEVLASAECVGIARDWANEPSNVGTPEYFAKEAQRLARKHGLKCRVLTEKEIQREKMGLFLGVGAGSEREGRIVVLEYTPKGAQKGAKKTKTVALVGKGVTFDSGGISIKPSARMEEMKYDMTGAATVFGAILLAARWQVANRVVAYLGLTENMPDGAAIQPGNILVSRAGKTVEVVNTDAEGRLILADLLDYAQDDKPDAIVDVATLTGAVSIALGKQCCAVLGNDDGLVESLKKASEAHHEKMWELPLWDEYFDDMKCEHADMKNVGPDSNGGTIRGAIFMKQFIRKKQKWAHLDIAAMAYHLGHLPYCPKRGASGLYVRTLAQFTADYR